MLVGVRSSLERHKVARVLRVQSILLNVYLEYQHPCWVVECLSAVNTLQHTQHSILLYSVYSVQVNIMHNTARGDSLDDARVNHNAMKMYSNKVTSKVK